jgi:ParB-like chromosome segregation protein Spo0J
MAIKDLIVGRSDLYRVDPNILNEDPGWNARRQRPDLDTHIRMLADSIKEVGVKETLTCYIKDDVLFVTDGHCRLRATMLAISEGCEIKSVPMKLEDRYSNEADRTLSMITRNSGLPLTQLEIADVVKRLLAFGWEMNQIAAKTGFSISHINNMLNLSSAPEEIVKMVQDGEVSATLAQKIVREKGSAEAVEVLKSAVDTSKKAGKKKTTEKDLNSVKEKKVSWRYFGPLLYNLMKEIYDTPATDKNKVFQKIAEAGEVLGEIELIQGE